LAVSIAVSRFKASIEGIFVEIERVGARLVTSEIAFTEVLVVPFRAGNDESGQPMSGFWIPS